MGQQPGDTTTPAPLVSQFVDTTVRVTLLHNVHPLARPEFDRGEAASDLSLARMLMVLKRSPEQEAALQQLLEHQQDVDSPSYHRWLTPQQFGELFGPAQGDIDKVTQWLASSGFHVAGVSASHLFIDFSGNATQVRQAFGTPIHSFVVNGLQHYANVSNPTIPIALAPVVAGIDSLNNFQRRAQNIPMGAYSFAKRSLDTPAYTFGGGPSQVPEYAIGPYDFAAIYDLFPLWNATPTPVNGAGQTIAIVGRSDINPADAATLWNFFGLDGTHAPQPKLVVTYNGMNPGKTDDEAEADIDTQWSGAVAPGATIDLVVSASTATTDGVDLSALYIVDNNLATVLSESYGACEASMGATGVQFYGSLWQQAAAQGISVFVSSGDNGAAGCDDPSGPAKYGVQVNGIASTPFNAAVGGTDFNQFQNWSSYWNSASDTITQQSAKGYIPETSWNDSCTNSIFRSLSGGSASAEANCNNSSFKTSLVSTAGGGGKSSSWLKPTWQTGTLNDNARDVPDVSLFASNGFLNSYYLVCQSDFPGRSCSAGGFQGFGGTSVTTPEFAGIMALINQKTGSAQGNPGLKLYKLAAQQPSVFHDIPAGSTIEVPCVTGTPNCVTSTASDAYGVLSGYATGAGYDLATGLGSVDVANLVNQWQSVSFTSSATTLSLNGGAAVNVAHGAAVPFSISVTPTMATGSAALMIAPGTPGDPGIAGFALTSGAVAASTTLLPGGSYNILAHYSGDFTYGGSYSNSVAVTVAPEASTSFVQLISTNVNGVPSGYSVSSATYGVGYQYLRVDVGDGRATLSPSTGVSSLCASRKESCPTGKILLRAPGTSLDGMSLQLNNEGFAQIPAPPPGTYTVNAMFAGDASFGASSGSTTFTIAKAVTTATANVSGLPVQYGIQESIVAGALTTSDGVAPTGTFQFYADGNPILAPQLVSGSRGYGGVVNGTTSYATADSQTGFTFLSVGPHTLSVQYSGDANYATSTSAVSSFTVAQARTIFSDLGVSNPAGGAVVAGQPAVAVATVFGSQVGAPLTGTITFYSNNVVIPGAVTYSSTAPPLTYSALTATLPTVFATPGTYSITAAYSGDANYTPASPGTQPLRVLGPVSITKPQGIVIASPGSGGTSSFSVTPNGGFSGAATVTCTPDPAAKEASCTLVNGTNSGSTVQVDVSGAGPSITLNMATTAPHQLARQERPPMGPEAPLVLAGLLALFLPAFRRRRKYLLCILGVSLTLGLSACGGGSSGSGGNGGVNTDQGTAVGAYEFSITATTGSGASAFTITSLVSVTVQ